MKNKKELKWLKRLANQYNKNLKNPHFHFDVLLASVILLIIWLFFSSVILYSISFKYYTEGISIPLNQFFNSDASSSQALTYHLKDFGLYNYDITITPAKADSLSAWLEGNGGININAIISILQGFNGPYLNGYGIAYVVFEAVLLAFVLYGSINFSIHFKFLKLNKETKNIWRYFHTFYGLIISAIILSSIITYANVIPGKDILIPLIKELVAKKSASSNKGSSINVSSYLDQLQGSGLPEPISAFGTVYVKMLSINETNYLHVYVKNAIWSIAPIIVYGCYLIVFSTLLPLLKKMNYKQLQQTEKISVQAN